MGGRGEATPDTQCAVKRAAQKTVTEDCLLLGVTHRIMLTVAYITQIISTRGNTVI